MISGISLLQNLKGRISDCLTFNRAEQRGIFALLVLLSGVVVINCLIPSSTLHDPVDLSVFTEEAEAFGVAYARAAGEDSVKRRRRMASGNGGQPIPLPDTLLPGAAVKKPAFVVELNGADTLELQRLRGIGPAFARRIVQYRERLGGYVEVAQLLEVFGMDPQRFGYIQPYLCINTDSVKKLDLNRVGFKTLLRHPYFPYPVARNIILWREKHKRFTGLTELNDIDGVTDSLFKKIVPYVLIR